MEYQTPSEKCKFLELTDKLLSLFQQNKIDDEETLDYLTSYIGLKSQGQEDYKWRMYLLISFKENIIRILQNQQNFPNEKIMSLKEKIGNFPINEVHYQPINEVFIQFYNNYFTSKKEFTNKKNDSLTNYSQTNESSSFITQKTIHSSPSEYLIKKDASKGKDANASANANANDSFSKKIDEILAKINMHDNIAIFIKEFCFKTQDGINSLFSMGNFNEHKKIKALSVEYKLKLLTIFSKLSFIFTDKQKKCMLEKFNDEFLKQDRMIENKSLDRINNNLFYLVSNKTFGDFFKLIREEEEKVDALSKKLMYEIKTKEDIKCLYLLYCVNHNLKFFESSADYEVLSNKLSFVLLFTLSHLGHFDMESEYEFLCDLYVIKMYYGDLGRFESFLDVQNCEIVYNNVNFVRPLECDTDFKSLFTVEEIQFNKLVIDNIGYFYPIDKQDHVKLLNPRNIEFTMKYVELVFHKQRYIYNSLPQFKKNLISLEKILVKNYRDTVGTFPYDKFKLPSDMAQVFQQLSDDIHNNFHDLYAERGLQFNLFPFGSVTQFLSGKDSDLDIYLELYPDNKDAKLKFFEGLKQFIKIKYDNRVTSTCSSRVCVISFKFNQIKVDINYFGICQVLHSSLMRIYSTIDLRFPILAVNLKILVKSLGINNTERFKQFLNSFSLMMLLMTFLQDVITPPVLPKLLEFSEQKKILIEQCGGKKINLKFGQKTQMTFADVIKNSYYNEFLVSNSFLTDYQQISESCLTVKNPMSVSELFLSFLEFIIFYFKYDTVFVHGSFGGECYMNMSDIENINDTKFLAFYDKKFNSTKKKSGDILIRDPFDHSYNPAHTMTNPDTRVFFEQLKRSYFTMIKDGKLS